LYVGFCVRRFESGLIADAAPGIGGPQPDWAVADAQQAYGDLLRLGVGALHPVTQVGEGIEVAPGSDPCGNRLGIIENPNFRLEAVR
jgi:hypothetical protein